MSTDVYDLNTGDIWSYTCSPFTAVRSAYAQREKNDYNSWEYEKYNPLVIVRDHIYLNNYSSITCRNQYAVCLKGKEHDLD